MLKTKPKLIELDRADFLQRLESVQPGLSNRDILEQSASFVFRNSKVYTFNGEIVCRAFSGLPLTVEGAVVSGPLLNILKAVGEEKLQVKFDKSRMTMLGHGRGCEIKQEGQISLPLNNVEWPKKSAWKDLSPKFCEAIALVQECAGKDISQFAWTCVHIHPEWVEACDNYQMTRYKVRTPIKKPILVRKDSIKHIPILSMTEVAETYDWIHFRNPAGIQVGIKRFHENEFPSMDHLLAAKGRPMRLPKGLGPAAKVASNFSKENKDDDGVLVEITSNRIKVVGMGYSGKYWENKKVKYGGEPLAFIVAPGLLQQITKKHSECRISSEFLRVDGTKWVYVTSLGDPKETEKAREDANDEALEEDDDE